MDDEHVIYRSYLLRIWHTRTTDAFAWRLLIEDVQSRRRYGFTDLEQLLAFLREQAGASSVHAPAQPDAE